MNPIFMMLSLVGFLLTLIHPGSATTSAFSPASDLPYPVQVMQYHGEIGGHEVELNGTVQEILTQMTALHPDFDRASFVSANTNALDNRSLNPRDKSGLICVPVPGWNWKEARESDITQGINELMALGRIGVNGNQCARLSCYGQGAIYLCNANSYFIQPALPYLASYAQDIVNQCGEGDGFAGGQEFDSDNYNIIVRLDTC